jgi:hypothetical protein
MSKTPPEASQNGRASLNHFAIKPARSIKNQSTPTGLRRPFLLAWGIDYLAPLPPIGACWLCIKEARPLFLQRLKTFPQQSSGTNKNQEKITLPPILTVYFPSIAVFCT